MHWVIDTDYENYAVHYSCREVGYDGTCLDGYSFIFSRHPTGLRAEDQPIVTQRKTELCLIGKYRRVDHNGTYGGGSQASKNDMASSYRCSLFFYKRVIWQKYGNILVVYSILI